jgi:hypothetical protein
MPLAGYFGTFSLGLKVLRDYPIINRRIIAEETSPPKKTVEERR